MSKSLDFGRFIEEVFTFKLSSALCFHKELVEFICAEYGLQEVLECYQAAYLSETPPVYDNHLQIRCAVEDGLQTIMTT